MDFTTCMAVVAVSDLDQAKDFYRQLFGRVPDRAPMPTLAQWDLPNASAFQVVDDPGRAGSSMATLVVPHLDDAVTSVRTHGIQLGPVVDGVLSRLVQLRDPAGNLLTLVEPS